MSEWVPFRALRYNLEKTDIREVVSPPYDIITPQQQKALHDRSPYNVVRLILGLSEGEQSWYPKAAATFQKWKETSILVRDPEPSVYLYSQDYRSPHGETQSLIGFLGLIRLKPWGEGIYPHEKTLSKPKEDRYQVMLHLKANLEAIYSVYSDPSSEIETELKEWMRGDPLFDFRDEEKVRHRMWRISDARKIDWLRKKLEGRDLFIADGHHRYETALRYRDFVESGASPLAPNRNGLHHYILMFLTAMESPGITLLPTHRVVKGLPHFDTETFLEGARKWFKVEEISQWSPDEGEGITLFSADRLKYWRLQLDREKAELDPRWIHLPNSLKSLDLVALQLFLFEKVLGMSAENIREQRYLEYLKDGERGIERIQRGEGQAVFLMRPPTVSQIREVSLEHQTMPQKSTYFYPKPLSGLVIHPIDPSESAYQG